MKKEKKDPKEKPNYKIVGVVDNERPASIVPSSPSTGIVGSQTSNPLPKPASNARETALRNSRKHGRDVNSSSRSGDRGPKRLRLATGGDDDDDDDDGDGDGDDEESVSLSELEGLLVLEYLARGDLKRWIGKANGLLVRIPAKAVWHMMRCSELTTR